MPETRIRLYGIRSRSVRALLAMEDAGRLVAGRPAGAFALRVTPALPADPRRAARRLAARRQAGVIRVAVGAPAL